MTIPAHPTTTSATTGSPAHHSPAHPSPATHSRLLILLALLAGGFMILLDATIVNVAIPSIQRDLSASYGAAEWVVAGYALSYGLLLIPSGRLGDRYGHKPVFLLGLTGFVLFSVLCATADTPLHLVIWRVAQGAAAGMVNPPILAIIRSTFPGRAQGKAFAAYGAMAGISTALGPLVGGLLLAGNLGGLQWRPIFLLNLPIGVAALAAAVIVLPAVRGRAGGLDPVGIGLATLSVLLLTVPLVQGRDLGWPLWTYGSMIAVGPALALFAGWELRRVRHGHAPLVDVRLLANRSFAAGTVVSLIYFAGFIGLMFVVSLYLQLGLGFSALRAGCTVLAYAVGTFAGAACSHPLAQRLGRRLLLIGSAMAAVATAGLVATVHELGPRPSAWVLVPWLLVAGVGNGWIIAPLTDVTLAGVPHRDAGAAGGMLNTAQRIGQALGVAVLGVVLFGGTGAHAAAAAGTATPALSADLAAAGLPAPAAQQATIGFADCFTRRARAADPTVVPPGCPADSAAGPTASPADRAFGAAADTALAEDFSAAVQPAALGATAAFVLTFLAVLALPARRRDTTRRDDGHQPVTT
jgi:EmrB/QacA subfamily drug resistance transporter